MDDYSAFTGRKFRTSGRNPSPYSFKKAKENIHEFDAFFYKHKLESLMDSDEKFSYPIDLVLSDEEYSFIEVNNEVEMELINKLTLEIPRFDEIENLSIGTDFHKTNDSSYFMEINENNIPLYEGKFMNQFSISPDQLTEGIAEEVVKNKLANDYKEYRIAIRTIARATDKRSLICTLLPNNSVATNSLHVQREASRMSLEEKLFYVGILNSYIVDFYLRNLITTNVNERYLVKLPIAKYGSLSSTFEINSIVKNLLMANGSMYSDLNVIEGNVKHSQMTKEDLIAELNALIFKEYGLTREEIIVIMKSFESANHRKEVVEEAQRIINIFDTL